jgi:crotonobetainyl-CoA:carnitine CoA-transferase CaiB-like acyl-CoA transferase
MNQPFCPLQGVRVLDLSRNLPGPFLTRILGDLGAEVIRVEPLTGEGMRWMPPSIDGIGAMFGGLNAGKDSLAVDLKAPAGLAFVKALAVEVDVLVEGFRPGKLAALGLAPEALMAANPRLIVCSITGYGQTGSMAAAAGHDLNYLARAGLLGLTGPVDGPPQVPGLQAADVGGGSLSAAIGVLAALIERDRTGRGRHLDISMTRGATAFAATAYAGTIPGTSGRRGAGMLTGGAPCYRCYRAADGRYMALGALEPTFFGRFCELAGRPELAASQYARGEEAVAVHRELEQLFESRTSAAWMELCDGHDVCLEVVRTPAEAAADPEFSDVVRDVGGFTVVSAHVGGSTPAPTRPPSQLGADVAAVVARVGLDQAVVDAAVAAGALLWPEAGG